MKFLPCLSILVALALPGCASTPPSTFYSLSSLPATESQASGSTPDLAIGLGPVTFPVFLDRPQIVSRASGNRLTLNEFHRWGGTIQDDFLRVWSENLAQLLGTGQILIFPSEIRAPLDLRIAADVLAFEGTPDGQALLKVRWTVLDGDLESVLIARESRYRRPLAVPGDDEALIAALSAALGDFSREVATAVSGLPKFQTAPAPTDHADQSPPS